MSNNDIQVICLDPKPNNNVKFFSHVPGHYKVMAVAVLDERHEEWFAYIKDVPGENHDKEWRLVAREGGALDKQTAELWFPYLKHYNWSRFITFSV